jgi:GNAT superfamily N-acetyltransferase
MIRAHQTLTFPFAAVRFSSGTRLDLARLLRHHYRPGLPATICAVRVAAIRVPHTRAVRIVGVAALSWPVPMLRARNRHFGVSGYRHCLGFANSRVRTISRVIVHPQFRAAGIAQELVRQLIARCPTRYIESSTSMGAFAGFLTRCGFEQIPTEPAEPAYFLLDREGRN